MQTSSLAIFTQWLIFSVAIATVLVPAFVFRKIALKRNKKPWLYFLAGMGIGLACLPLSRLLAAWMMQLDVIPSDGSYVSGVLAFLVVPVAVVTVAVMVVRGRVARVG